jgi:hypothetical protein
LALTPRNPHGDIRRAPLLYDLVRNHWLRAGAVGRIGFSPAFSRDGSRAAWLAWHSWVGIGEPEIFVAQHASGAVESSGQARTVKATARLLLAPLGDRLAIFEEGKLRVVRLPGFGPLAVASLSPFEVVKATFVTADLVRLWQVDTTGLAVRELSLVSGRLTTTGHLDLPEPVRLFRLAPSGDRLIVRYRGQRGARVFDARSGAALQALPLSGDRDVSWDADFLSDGGIVTAEAAPSGAEVRIYDGGGGSPRPVHLDAGATGSVALGPQPSADQLVVTTSGAFGRRAWLVDRTGPRARPLGTDLEPALLGERDAIFDAAFRPDRRATRLFLGERGELVEIELPSSRTRPLLPAQ